MFIVSVCFLLILTIGSCTAIKFTNADLKKTLDSIPSQIQEKLANIPDQRFPIKANLKVCNLNGEVNLTNIKINQLTVPALSHTLIPPSSVKMNAVGGAFEACFDYSMKGKCGILPVPFNGGLCLTLEKAGVNIDVQASLSAKDCKPKVDVSPVCSVKVPVDFHFRDSVAKNTLLKPVLEVLEKFLRGLVSEKACELSQVQFQKALEKKIPGFVSVCSFAVTDEGIDIGVKFG